MSTFDPERVPASDYATLRDGITELLLAARRVNALMTAAYWEIGRRIVEVEQRGVERAAYGEALIARLAVDLSARFGRGFSRRNLEQMRAFYRLWPAPTIAQTPSAQSLPEDDTPEPDAPALAIPLPWSAYVVLLSVSSGAARTFYEIEALRGGWSVRQLRRQIDSQFYERTALSHDKAAMLSRGADTTFSDEITPEEAIKDPYVLEFLDLKDEYSESELEAALIERLANFLLELGDDFAFVGRQPRLRLDEAPAAPLVPLRGAISSLDGGVVDRQKGVTGEHEQGRGVATTNVPTCWRAWRRITEILVVTRGLAAMATTGPSVGLADRCRRRNRRRHA